MLNTNKGRKTHAPDSHQWKLLPWFCLLWRRPWTIQVSAVATVEWQLEWQWSNIRSIGRVRWNYKIGYNSSMLEYKVIKFPPWLFSTMTNTDKGMKTHPLDSHRLKPIPWLRLLRRQLWTVVGIRSRIRVTVFIGDCQVCVLLPLSVFGIIQNCQDVNLITLYSNIERL